MRRIPSYPNRILPGRASKIIQVNKSLHDYYLIRYDTRNQPIPDAETFDKIHKENFSTGYFKNGWSTTLLGVYSKNDARFVIKKEVRERLSKPWLQGEKSIKVRNKDIDYVINRGFFGLMIRDVLSCSFDLIVTINNKYERTDKVSYEIVHEPTHSNYWHFSIYAYAINENTKEKYYLKDNLPSKNSASNATRNIADILKRYVVLQPDVLRIAVPKSIYSSRAKKQRFYKAKRSK